jgi:hypothetical protein
MVTRWWGWAALTKKEWPAAAGGQPTEGDKNRHPAVWNSLVTMYMGVPLVDRSCIHGYMA